MLSMVYTCNHRVLRKVRIMHHLLPSHVKNERRWRITRGLVLGDGKVVCGDPEAYACTPNPCLRLSRRPLACSVPSQHGPRLPTGVFIRKAVDCRFPLRNLASRSLNRRFPGGSSPVLSLSGSCLPICRAFFGFLQLLPVDSLVLLPTLKCS